MLTAGNLEDVQAEKSDILILNGLLQREKGTAFDQYIYATFSSFCQHKKEIILNLSSLYYANEPIRDLIMNKINK